VNAIVDRLVLVRRPSADVTMGLIHWALASEPRADAVVIHVSILENDITLTGVVQTDEQRRLAERAAWAVPHVVRVYDYLSALPL
jgi:osmotically-inducible protein OsmY